METHEKINKKLRILWNKLLENNFFEKATLKLDSSHEVKKYRPIQYSEFKKNQVLYIGLNPSANDEDSLAKIPVEQSKLPNEMPKNLNDLADRELEALGGKKRVPKNAHTYFKRLIEFHDLLETNLSWEHVDIFGLRETSQNRLKKVFDIGNVNETVEQSVETKYEFSFNPSQENQWAKEQVEIFEELVREIEPKLVLVANAFGFKLLKALWQDSDRIFDVSDFLDNKGHHELSCDGWEVDIPIFFSGMISGQRALDVHNRFRLAWNIKNTLK